jgi:hypothetical protein
VRSEPLAYSDLPSPVEVDVARGEAMRNGNPGVKICRGGAKGCIHWEPEHCPNCYVVEANDPRSSREILAAMERGDA